MPIKNRFVGDVQQPISADDINEELNQPVGTTVDFESVFEENFNQTKPHGMLELFGQSALGTFTYQTAQVTGFEVSRLGVITPPSSEIATITERTYVGSISNTSYGQVTSETTRTVNVKVRVPGGYNNTNAIVSGSETYPQPDNNFSIDDAGVVTSISDNGTINVSLSQGTLSYTDPASYNATDSGEKTYTIYINIPSGYANYPGTISQSYTRTKTAAARTLSLSSDASNNITDGNDISVRLYVTDDNYSDTSWTIAAVGTPTLSNYSLSTTSGTGTTTVTLSFDKNLNGIGGAQRNGTFQVTGPANSPSIIIRQSSAASPPTVEISDPASNFAYNDTTTYQTLTGTITGGDGASQAYFICYDSNFEFVQTQSDVTVTNSGGISQANVASSALSSRNSFTVGVRPTGTNSNTSVIQASVLFFASNGTNGNNDSTTVTQNYNVTWNTNVSSLSFPTNGGTQYVTLNTSEPWTAAITNVDTNDTGNFTVSPTSGTAGTHTITVTKSDSSDKGDSGTLTFSATGQTDIPVTLTQAAAPLEFYYYVNSSSTGETTSPRSLGTLSYLGESVSIGLYTYRGSTSVSTPFNLQKGNAVSGYGVGTTTSDTSSSVTSNVYTTQSTGGSATKLYINASSNSGNSSTRSIDVELYVDGVYEVTFTATQAADPNAGSGGGGEKPPIGPIE